MAAFAPAGVTSVRRSNKSASWRPRAPLLVLRITQVGMSRIAKRVVEAKRVSE
jgi:hypothetical protein